MTSPTLRTRGKVTIFAMWAHMLLSLLKDMARLTASEHSLLNFNYHVPSNAEECPPKEG